MANHRSQAQFDRAKWRLRILGPAWLLQLALNVTLMGLFAWRLGDTMKNYDGRKRKGEQPTIEVVWEAANVFLSFTAAVCTCFEIARFYGESLTPWTMLFTQVIKLFCASGILALDVVVLIQLGDENYSIISLGVDGAFLLIVTGLTIYAIIIYRRLSTHQDYARSNNVKSFGFSDGVHRDSSIAGRLSTVSILDKRRLSFNSSRRVSVSDAEVDPANELRPLERTPSYYSHQRDTQFDEYMARRNSYNADVEAARGDEVFGGRSGNNSPPEIVVSSGTVVSRPGELTTRSLSTTSDHVLVAVPEAHEEDEEDLERDDKQALLGNKRRRSSTDLGGPVVEQDHDVVVPKWQQR